MNGPPVERTEPDLFGWPEELRVLHRFGLTDGHRILDLGCGRGSVAAELVRQLPTSHLVGVDSNLSAVPVAADALRQAGDRARVVRGSVLRLPLLSDRFDFAVARLVFQYLSSPVDAAREALRVLRPGGRLAVSDVDRDLSFAVHPELPELHALMARYDAWHRGRGGDRGVGARLRDILQESGAESVETETIRFESHPETAEAFLDGLAGPRRLQELRAAGYVAKAELEDFLAARARWLVSPERAVTRYLRMACGVKSVTAFR